MRIDAISVNPDRAGKYRLQLSDGSVMKLYRQTIADFGLYAGMEMTEEEVNTFCMKLPRYKRPHKIIFADIPRNPTGKIEKPKLREMYGAENLIAEQNLG